MSREYARVRVDIWIDDDFRQLSRAAQHLYFVLLTSPGLSYCGVADWRPGRIAAAATDWTADEVREAAVELTDKLYIIPDEETEEVLIRSFIRHDGILKESRITVSMVKAFGAVASSKIRGVIVHELRRLHEEDMAVEDKDKRMKGWLTTRGEPGQVLTLLTLNTFDPYELRNDLIESLEVRLGVDLGQTTSNVSGSVSGITTPCPSPAPAPVTPDGVTKKNLSSGKPDADDRFDEFWAHYPRKDDKIKAHKAWRAVTKDVDPQLIIEAVQVYPFKPERNFKPLPASWLNGRRWEDESATQPELRLAASNGERTLTPDEVTRLVGPPPQLPRPPDGQPEAEYIPWAKRWRANDNERRLKQALEILARQQQVAR